MGVYIKGMEMPVAGQTILVVENWDGSIHARIEESFDNFHPVIEVPDHGRLIDADSLEEVVQDLWMQNEISNWDWMGFRGTLSEIPTIIPAEPGEEET